VLFALAGLALFGFTLTLPGLAGFALSIGMAVDANALIFERMREELQRGKTVRLSVDEGLTRHVRDHRLQRDDRADGGDPVLVGTGPVQGFAVIDHRHRRLDDHRRLRHTDPVPHLAATPAGHDHSRHLTMIRLFANANYDFISKRRWRTDSPRPC
jgi:hypothetical protein